MLNAIATGSAHVSNPCVGDDRTSVLRCLRGLGVKITDRPTCDLHGGAECFEVQGRGPRGLTEPAGILHAGNSGTTMRLMTGLLAAQPFFSVITGDRSLKARPMDRVVKPLRQMGAHIEGRHKGSLAPLAIVGGGLEGVEYTAPVASAQVKSSLMIAGINADGTTVIHQPAQSRDHTERLMRSMGAAVTVDGLGIQVSRSELTPIDVEVPGDISSAAFWLVAGCCHPDARITIRNVGINPTRAGVLAVLARMGANIRMENVREDAVEPVADLVAESSTLSSTEIGGAEVAAVVDELPVLSVAACFADGTTTIRGAKELRFKESDRIHATVDGLTRLGASVEEREDGVVVHGGRRLQGARVESHGDHRIAMALAIAGLLAQGPTSIKGADAASVSYPEFWSTLERLAAPVPVG